MPAARCRTAFRNSSFRPATNFYGRRGELGHDLRPHQTRFKSMNSGNQDKVEGTAKEAMGTVKEKTGEVIGNERLEAEGTAEKAEGKVQDKVGDVKKVFEQ
jgi:uncharacterized protein YjbJ (UPF0337 family)